MSDAQFEIIFDLEVEGKTLFGVEFTIAPDGNYRYRVPDCIRTMPANPPNFITQVTIDGLTVVSNEAFTAALIEKAKTVTTGPESEKN